MIENKWKVKGYYHVVIFISDVYYKYPFVGGSNEFNVC